MLLCCALLVGRLFRIGRNAGKGRFRLAALRASMPHPRTLTAVKLSAYGAALVLGIFEVLGLLPILAWGGERFFQHMPGIFLDGLVYKYLALLCLFVA